MKRYRAAMAFLRQRWRLGLAATVALCVVAAWIRMGPLPPSLLDDPPVSTLVVDRNGRPLYEARAGDGTRGLRMSPDSLPQVVVDATVAAEDHRFWAHPGIDPVAIARAIRANLAERSVVEGGSTISQQVAKLLLNQQAPNRYRGWPAKLHEAVLALRLEHRLGKRELIALYLSLAGYGNQIVGIERASQVYFARTASMLTPAQAAFLAGLPQRPSAFNPYRNLDAALARQRTVLARMEQVGALTAVQAREARDERLALNAASSAFVAPHFVQMVLGSLGDDRPSRIETTLDAGLQADVTGVIESHRAMLRRHGANNVAVVVLDNDTGEWLAWEGSGDYANADAGGTINGPTTLRQPGSALKPFTYALAFERGFSPASVLADIPSSFPTDEEGIVYAPRNYDGRFRGPMLARVALAGSENVPAVALASELGVATLQRFLGRAGLSTLDKTASHYGLGLTLGNAEVRLDELTAAYMALARGGEWIEPVWRRSDASRPTRRIVSQRTAFWIADILSDPEAREYAFGRGGSLELPFPVAVKTGTSQAYHDNWTIGYSRHVTVGVWVGNFDRRPLRNSSGVTGAAPIFHGVMLAAERRVAGSAGWRAEAAIVPAAPDSVQREICTLSGGAANGWCPTRRREWVAAERLPDRCAWHHLADGDVETVLPVEYAPWESGSSAPRATPRATRTAAATQARRGDRPAPEISIVSPANGATYLIDPTLRREFQSLALKAASSVGGPIQWTVNGQSIGSTRAGRALDWPLVPGRHHFTARDPEGRAADATIVVK